MIRTSTIALILAGMLTGVGILTAATMVFYSVALWLGGTFAHALIANSEGRGYTPTIWLLLPLAIHLAVTAVVAVVAATLVFWWLRSRLHVALVVMALSVNLIILLVLLLPTIILVLGSFIAG